MSVGRCPYLWLTITYPCLVSVQPEETDGMIWLWHVNVDKALFRTKAKDRAWKVVIRETQSHSLSRGNPEVDVWEKGGTGSEGVDHMCLTRHAGNWFQWISTLRSSGTHPNQESEFLLDAVLNSDITIYVCRGRRCCGEREIRCS
jgi:hypothetical protein